ncbi:hypothetical protein HPB52_012119 [Rhipicephalus sanguineus]|uniref:Uncharacterized protein n=1 Tax=Rhipicephalus sanguineus TaxID=34632 RepID=A0A9D4QAG8_RHISA|nr:hypothetical protein HPB52_012119 [Rhipicephalus sanguineus]
MALGTGSAPVLDQIASQTISFWSRRHTVWQWAEPLRPISIKVGKGQQNREARLNWLPLRASRSNGFIIERPGKVETIPLYQTLKSLSLKSVGEFQANCFFNYGGIVDVAAVAGILSQFDGALLNDSDETPFSRCALLSEMVMLSGTALRVTQLPFR